MDSPVKASTKIYGLIGHPVSHSFSPAMHNTAFSKLKLDAVYGAFDVPPERLEHALKGVCGLGIAGLNVTVPHKSAVIPHLDRLEPLAKTIGAVNTIVNHNGSLRGTSTDSAGFLRALKENGMEPNGLNIVMLGAGGSARALLAGLAEANASSVRVWNRTTVRAQNLVKDLKPIFPGCNIQHIEKENLMGLECDLLINTTSAGMHNDETAYDLNHAVKVGHVADIIYNPPKTPLLKQAEQLGIPCHNGLAMLLYQGCESFTFWTGQDAPVKEMRQALVSQLKQPH